MTEKTLRVALFGNVPTAKKIIMQNAPNAVFEQYELGTEPNYDIAYDLFVVYCPNGEGLDMRGMTCNYIVDGKEVITPVRLLNDPPCNSARFELGFWVREFLKEGEKV